MQNRVTVSQERKIRLDLAKGIILCVEFRLEVLQPIGQILQAADKRAGSLLWLRLPLSGRHFP